MIWIQCRRAGFLVIAANANGSGEIQSTWAFTEEGARRRLMRRMSRQMDA